MEIAIGDVIFWEDTGRKGFVIRGCGVVRGVCMEYGTARVERIEEIMVPIRKVKKVVERQKKRKLWPLFQK